MAGQLVTAFAVTYALAAPVMVVATARWPRRRTIVAGLAAFAVINLAAAAAPGYAALLVLRIAAAVLDATITPAAVATVAELAPPQRRGRYLGVGSAGLTGALVLGVPLGTWIGGALGWRSTFVFVTALGLTAVVGCRRRA